MRVQRRRLKHCCCVRVFLRVVQQSPVPYVQLPPIFIYIIVYPATSTPLLYLCTGT